jgi:ferredoxin
MPLAGRTAMKVVVNLTRCEAYAQCAFLAPEVFRMRGAEASTSMGQAPWTPLTFRSQVRF